MKGNIQREQAIFEAATRLPAGPEREAYLAQACAGNAALREGVDALLAAHDAAETFLAQPAGLHGPAGTKLLPVSEKAGDKIGRYKLLQQIGEGGCGVVYMAEQEEPVRRRVALKVIRLGMDTKSVVARFEAERQALALMDHPNIAKVFDGGATESGRPYFVMELVRGIRITDYCDQAHLSTSERLKLFIQVCHAVQHAHQKGVIHRDIKPSNILVTVNDGVAVPKVIDFGIAKATDQRLTDKTYFTEFQAFIGTPAYTSPEQAEMSSLDIDTRSDIYSLGVLLYELLTGQTPFPAERLLQSGLDEMRRIIREEEPPKPSTQLTLGRAAPRLTGSPRPASGHRTSEIDQDLDWIVMKALEKDRTRRYATSLDFASDLQRHLNSEAVLARPPSLAYKFRRAVRRNKGAFAATAAVFVALLIGLGLTAWQAVRATKAERAARFAQQAEKVHAEQARVGRDRAILAESNVIANAIEVRNALQTANERMVKLNVAEGWRRVEEGDHFGALLPFAEAFALEQDKPERAEIHQMRLASVLQRSPKLVNVWSVETNIGHAEFSRDGERLVIYRRLGKVYDAAIWDSSTGRMLVQPVDEARNLYPHWISWSGDGKRFVTESHLRSQARGPGDQPAWAGKDGSRDVRVWESSTAQPVSPLIPFDDSDLVHLHFDSYAFVHSYTTLNFDGTRLLRYGSNTLSLWDVASGTNVWRHRPHSDTSQRFNPDPLKFSPDGRHLIFAGGILDARSGTSVSSATNILFAEFSLDGQWLFMTEGKKEPNQDTAVLRNTSDLSRMAREWKQGPLPYLGRFGRDGKRLVTANGDSTLRVWNASDGSPATSPMELGGLASDVCFSPDGAWLAVGTGRWAEMGYAQVWDVATGKPVTPRLPHDGPVLRVAFGKDNTQLFVVGNNGTVAVWSLAGFDVPRFTWTVPESWSVKLSPDGKVLACKSGSRTVFSWSPGSFQHGRVVTTWAYSLESGDVSIPPLLMSSAITPLSADRLLEAGWAGWTEISLKDGSKADRSVAHYFNTTNEIHVGAVFVRGGGAPAPSRWAAAHHDDGVEILVFDTSNGSVAARLDSAGLSNSITALLVRQDGRQVLAGRRNLPIVCWNVTASNRVELAGTEGWKPESYGRSGRVVRLQHEDKPGHRLVETESFRDVIADGLIVHETSEDDTWVLALHNFYDRWRVYSATNAALQSPVLTHRGTIDCGALTPDSRIVITSGTELALRFWTVPAAEPAALPLILSSDALDIQAAADGRGFVTVHDDDTLRFWELPKSKRPVSDWLALARFFSKGRGIGPSGTDDSPRSLGPQSYRTEWLALRARHPEVFTVSADEIDAWHRHEAWRCESAKNWSNAIAHLSALLQTHPDSGDFLPRRAAAYVAMASKVVTSTVSRTTSTNEPLPQEDQSRLTSGATNYLERAIADYNRTLAWVDRFPAIAKESRLPFVEKRREVYLKLGRKSEAEADERELKSARR